MKSDEKQKLYLLGGNGSSAEWWKYTVPYFKQHKPVPIELPGFGNMSAEKFNSLYELSTHILKLTEQNSIILAQGINSIPVLQCVVNNPSHFKKILLLSPVGVFLWKSRFANFLKYSPLSKSIKYFISRFPGYFVKKYSAGEWSSEIIKTYAEGYKSCSAFEKYFKIIKPQNAYNGLEWIKNDVNILFGEKDDISKHETAAAWEGILDRADLKMTFKENWGHYPFFDNPENFAETIENILDGKEDRITAHTKAGRILLAKKAGLTIPKIKIVVKNDFKNFNTDDKKLYAVRSSSKVEDQAEASGAGLKRSFIRVKGNEVKDKIQNLLNDGMNEVIVQEFLEPEVSGVAFVRNISCEVEWVQGHLEELLQGKQKPFSAILSKMKGEWERGWNKNMDDAPFTVMLDELVKFLNNCISKFHFRHSDIEWAWDGEKFYLLQIRPVTVYNWHRFVTSANLDEILPKQVSKLMDYTQRTAATSISRIYSMWDGRVNEDNEPFTALYKNASYINSDLFLSRFNDWGLPSRLYSDEIGGNCPKLKFRFFRFVKNFPRFIKMMFVSRREILKPGKKIREFERELHEIPEKDAKVGMLVNWFVRYYTFIVQTNIVLKACLASSGGSFISKPRTVYADLEKEKFPHRLRFESDPAIPREKIDEVNLKPFPEWNPFIKVWNKLLLPGMRGKFIEIREWFRDNNMRLFAKFHSEMKGSEWFELSDGIRNKSGSFWQDEGEVLDQEFSFIIYPGRAEGIGGIEILLVETVEPGSFEEYKKAKAVIAKTGGKLSHGAILLRELKKPSAIIGELDIEGFLGKKIKYENGKIKLI